MALSIDTSRSITEAQKSGDVFIWYRLLRDQLNKWWFQFNDEERNKLTVLQNQCKNLLNQPNANQVKLNIDIIEDKLSEWERTLGIILNNYQRIFYQPEYTTWQERIKKQFE